MTRRAELEDALVESFAPAELEVYGDYLQSIDDPRGELIALDLRGLDEPDRRAELASAWFGAMADAIMQLATLEVGFVADLALDSDDPRSFEVLDAVLAAPGGGYLQGVTVQGDAPAIRAMLTRLAVAPQRWLTRLSIQHPAGSADGRVHAPAVDDTLAAQVMRALPRLEELEVWGRRVFGELAHPRVRSLRVTGADAIGALIGDAPARLPSVAVLDLALCVERDGSSARATLDGLLPAARLPKLRRLDLSRNEPGTEAPHYLGGAHDPFALLSQWDIRRQLTHVRMPSLRSRDQSLALSRAMADMPALRELEIVRAYQRISATPPATAREAMLWPWRPADRVVHYLYGGVVVVDTPGETLQLPEALLVRCLEDHYRELPPGAQVAWCALFNAVYGHPDQGAMIPRRSALSALDTLDEIDAEGDGLAAWYRLRAWLRVAPPNASLMLTVQ